MESHNITIRKMLLYCLVALSGLAFACDRDDDEEELLDNEIVFNNIVLSGDNQVPPVATSGSGTFSATYNRSTKMLSYNFTWTLGDENDNTIGIHFHGPALADQNAPVVIPIDSHPTSHTSSVTGETRELTETEEEQLLDGRWYINIHSTTYEDGELRGQLLRGEF
jgi:hypothetical protein